jgi:branched-chain amino acid transport system substrate-binding protein
MRVSIGAAFLAPLVALTLGAIAAGCSLGNVSRTDCETNAECESAFGVGSTCSGGFCSAPEKCETGHDCRKLIGGGACVKNACVNTIPSDACLREDEPPEPPDLLSQPLTGADAPVIIGSIFALEADPTKFKDKFLTQAVRLAVREINQAGLQGGQKIGVVFCDNGGTKNTAVGAERQQLDEHAVDFLAGTLGVPYIVGPRTSDDAIKVVNRIKKQGLPTAVISPSATGTSLSVLDDRLSPGDTGLFWRTCPNDNLQGNVLAQNVLGALTGVSKVTVVYVHDTYGDGLSQVFQSAYGVSKTALVPYDETTIGSASVLAKLASDADAKNGDAVLLIAHSGSIALDIIKAMEGLPIATKPFFFTDGSKDAALADPTLPTWIQDILLAAKITAPASPSGQDYDVFRTNLDAEFGVDATSASFLANTYDATYVGAFGLFLASMNGPKYDGRDVAKGMTMLSKGTEVHLTGVTGWTSGTGLLAQDGTIDVEGTSGHLDFDPASGEAPGRIGIWSLKPDLSGYTQDEVVPPN